jgi:NAD(P)-dependent dehydrogenase (short-subunit alcohol dehydrogenase family)
MTDLFDLSGKVAMVTGGSRGLGYQMVKAFAAHGADILVTSRKIEACEKVASEVKAMGRRAVTYACNVANWNELDGWSTPPTRLSARSTSWSTTPAPRRLRRRRSTRPSSCSTASYH